MGPRITSRRNQKIKDLRRLYQRQSSRSAERFVLEGWHLLAEAERAALNCHHIYVDDVGLPSDHHRLLRRWEKQGAEVRPVTGTVLEAVADTVTPQGVLAVCDRPAWDLGDLAAAPGPDAQAPALLVGCREVQDPGNLGTIVRSAAAFGVAGVLLSDDTVDPYHPKVLRAAAGALFHRPVVRTDSWDEQVLALQQVGWRTAAAVPRGGEPPEALQSGRWLVLLGNEGRGLPPATVERADRRVTVPTAGDIESLNVAMAGTVIVYAMRREQLGDIHTTTGDDEAQ